MLFVSRAFCCNCSGEIGLPITILAGKSARLRNSLISKASRRLLCKWLANWHNPLLRPSKNTGTTAACDFETILAVKLRQRGFIGWPNGLLAVLTVPPGEDPHGTAAPATRVGRTGVPYVTRDVTITAHRVTRHD